MTLLWYAAVECKETKVDSKLLIKRFRQIVGLPFNTPTDNCQGAVGVEERRHGLIKASFLTARNENLLPAHLELP